MPTYAYKCENDHRHEETRSIYDDPKVINCPDCGERLRPVYFSPAISLVGRGFYSNGG